jgi:glycosyltransferase involved in cell wall biosynthesis
MLHKLEPLPRSGAGKEDAKAAPVPDTADRLIVSSDMSFRDRDRKDQPVQRVMVFDLATHGHHAAYIKYLIQYLNESSDLHELVIVVSPTFLQAHADVVHFATVGVPHRVRFVAVTSDEEAMLHSRTSLSGRVLRNFREWNLMRKYAKALLATHCLVMYIDTCELPLLFGLGLPCPFSGIYFRPTFHYSSFANSSTRSLRNLFQTWRERLFLARMLNHAKMRTLFCLDPFAVKHIRPTSSSTKAVFLPDPIEVIESQPSCVESLKKHLNIAPGRRTFFLFGSFEAERKGVYPLLEAIALLPPDLSQTLCLLIAGKADEQEQRQINARVEAICQKHPVQIITRFEFIPDEQVAAYFQITDVVLATYQRHVGMSGILLLAAAALKPVLSSNYGLMGELVSRYQLGLAVDSTSPHQIAAGLTQFLKESPDTLGDRVKMQTFVERNAAKNFAKTILENLEDLYK